MTYMGARLQAPRGRHSVRGLGAHAPDPAGDEVDPDGARRPCGPVIRNEAISADATELQYNEYIVYDASQVGGAEETTHSRSLPCSVGCPFLESLLPGDSIYDAAPC